MTENNFAGYMAKSKLLTLVTIVLMIVPFFYEPWYIALPIAIGVYVVSGFIRVTFMLKSGT